MGPKKNDQEVVVKSKRGRKSKKELMAALNMTEIIKTDNSKNAFIDDSITLNVIDDVIENACDNDNSLETSFSCNENNKINDPVKIPKKRGRKPKGGKIVQQVTLNTMQIDDKPNVILHLKCSMKDLETSSQNNSVESYNFSNYELLKTNNIKSINPFHDSTNQIDDNDEHDDECVNKDSSKEIWKKLKQLEQNLHTNCINNKRSACFWDTCEFDNPPVYIPKHFINGTYHVYGCFCSPECGVAYLMNEKIDSSTKFERYHLFNHIYGKIYDHKTNIKPAPDPYHMLEKFYGNLSIQEYRSLLRNERLFLIVDKPLTKILPELHEDNEDFILNNKIIPSNNYNLKNKLKRKSNKGSILNEKFNANANTLVESLE